MKVFGGLVAVNSVDFGICERAIVSLIGPNGAGKTTFFNMASGLYKPTSGSFVFGGTDVRHSSGHASGRVGGRAYLPEYPPLRDDERPGRRARRDAHPAQERHPRIDPAGAWGAARERTLQLLRLVGLRERGRRSPRTSPMGTSDGWRSPAL